MKHFEFISSFISVETYYKEKKKKVLDYYVAEELRHRWSYLTKQGVKNNKCLSAAASDDRKLLLHDLFSCFSGSSDSFMVVFYVVCGLLFFISILIVVVGVNKYQRWEHHHLLVHLLCMFNISSQKHLFVFIEWIFLIFSLNCWTRRRSLFLKTSPPL